MSDCERVQKLGDPVSAALLDPSFVRLPWPVSAVGADLSGCDLILARLEGGNFSGANFTDANLSMAQLWDSNLVGANFTNANLRGANLERANAQGAILTNADINDVRFVGANTEGVNFDDTKKMDEFVLAPSDSVWARLLDVPRTTPF